MSANAACYFIIGGEQERFEIPAADGGGWIIFETLGRGSAIRRDLGLRAGAPCVRVDEILLLNPFPAPADLLRALNAFRRLKTPAALVVSRGPENVINPCVSVPNAQGFPYSLDASDESLLWEGVDHEEYVAGGHDYIVILPGRRRR